jgi:Tol biopolymer transport system component
MQDLYTSVELIQSPDWSPDGKHIAFAEGQHIRILNLDDVSVFLVNVAEAQAEFAVKPVWSPDGDQLVFQMSRLGQADFDLYTVALDHLENPVLVTKNVGANAGTSSNSHILWSPDSRQLVYATSAGKMYLINADGTDLVPLITDKEYAWPIAWLANPIPLAGASQ